MAGLERSTVIVKTMGADMVVVDVSKFFDSIIQGVIHVEIKKDGAFVFRVLKYLSTGALS